MEKTPPNSNLTSHDEEKNLLRNDTEEKPSSSTSEGTKAVPDSSANNETKSPQQSSGTTTPPPSTSRNSPDPCCAICLEPLQNKSFTNSCLHMFCFKCLVEWSKIKPECPLCKQQFKSIIHNVQEDFQYDTYYIKNRSTESFWNFTHVNQGLSSSFRLTTSLPRPRFRYRTTLTSDRLERTHICPSNLQMQFENHRRRFAPHSVSVISTSQTTNRMPSSFRRRIYDRNMWVKPSLENRFRITTPEFFRINPACTHRLLPWLNRELVVLLHNVESQIVFVLELIMSLIQRYEITSQEFFNQIRPYLLDRTSHFIHEFYNFAASPHNMETYDSRCTYEPIYKNVLSTINLPPNRSLPPIRDVITLDNEEESTNEITESTANSSNQRREAHKRKSSSVKNDHIEKMVLKRNRETDSWVTVMSPLPLMHDYTGVDYYSNPGPSTSGISSTRDLYERPTTPLSQRSTMISPLRMESSDDDCEVVEVLKPKWERTPEIVDLSSDEEIPRPNTPTPNGRSSAITPYYVPTSPLYEPTSPYYGPASPIYCSDSDIECVYESKTVLADSFPSNSTSRTPSPTSFVPPHKPSTPVPLSPVAYAPSSPEFMPTLSPSFSRPIISGNMPSLTMYQSNLPSQSSSSSRFFRPFAFNSPVSSPYSPVSPSYSPVSPYRVYSPGSPSYTMPTSIDDSSSSHFTSPICLSSSPERSSPVNLCKRSDCSGSKETSNNMEDLQPENLVKSKAPTLSSLNSPANAEAPSTSNLADFKPLVKLETKQETRSSGKPSIPSKVVVPNSNGVTEISHTHRNVPSNIKKKSSHFEKCSSESDSDTDKRHSLKKKKLKLRSVVAHFSFDNSDDRQSSSHRSSHKKHKDKKKKKKHSHKHKHRLHSDSDSSS